VPDNLRQVCGFGDHLPGVRRLAGKGIGVGSGERGEVTEFSIGIGRVSFELVWGPLLMDLRRSIYVLYSTI
jgi:hypothetical protein